MKEVLIEVEPTENLDNLASHPNIAKTSNFFIEKVCSASQLVDGMSCRGWAVALSLLSITEESFIWRFHVSVELVAGQSREC